MGRRASGALAGEQGRERRLMRKTGVKRVPKNYWKDKENCKRFMERFVRDMGITRPSHWKRVTISDVLEKGGRGLLSQYNNSLHSAIEDLMGPMDVDMSAWRPRMPRGYWEDAENRRNFMERVAREEGVREAKDWRRVTYMDIARHGGQAMLRRYGDSLAAALMNIFPEEEITAERVRERLPKSHWEDKRNQRAFLEELASKLNVTTKEGWRGVTTAEVERFGGVGLLARHGRSLLNALESVYPEEEWPVTSVRPVVPSSYWESEENVREFMTNAERELRISCDADWYRVSVAQLSKLSGSGLLKRMSLLDALRIAFPEKHWCEQEMARGGKKAQRALRVIMQRLFPSQVIHEDFRHPLLASRSAAVLGSSLEIDLWLPGLNLAIEYNGRHHYEEVPIFGPLEQFKRRDEEKKNILENNGVHFLVVPFWWDNGIESLAAALEYHFPGILTASLGDLHGSGVTGIPRELKTSSGEPMDEKRESSAVSVNNVTPSEDTEALNVMMRARERKRPFPARPQQKMTETQRLLFAGGGVRSVGGTLPTTWRKGCGIDVAGYLMQRHVKGLAVYWDGKHLATKRGALIPAPQWWRESLPAGPAVEGHLVAVVGTGVNVAGVVKSAQEGEEDGEAWNSLSLVASDLPLVNEVYARRMALLQQLPVSSAFQPVASRVCEGEDDLLEALEALDPLEEGSSGGFLLIDPQLRRHEGATVHNNKERPGKLRARKTHESEVLFVSVREQSRSLLVQTVTGTSQAVWCPQEVHSSPPPSGTVLKVAHFGFNSNSGRYQQPFLLSSSPRAWEEVVEDHRLSLSSPHSPGEGEESVEEADSQQLLPELEGPAPARHWRAPRLNLRRE